LRNGYTPEHPVPSAVSNICTDLEPTLAEVRTAIDITGKQAFAAGQNAKGLGYFSPSKHFRSIEDNDIVVNKVIEPSLNEVTDIPIAVDSQPDGPTKAAALELATAYEGSLRTIKRYSHASLVFERAAHGRKKEQMASFAGGGAQDLNRNNREMSADEARSILDDQSSGVGDAARQLKLPEYHWHKACAFPTVDAPVPSPSP
jgi:hypothetical protein